MQFGPNIEGFARGLNKRPVVTGDRIFIPVYIFGDIAFCGSFYYAKGYRSSIT